jgi:uncharacterized protein
MLRVVSRVAPHRAERAHVVLSGVTVLSIDDAAAPAEVIAGPAPRSLDAIHLATANLLHADLMAFVCYDNRPCDAAQALGLPVESPAP